MSASISASPKWNIIATVLMIYVAATVCTALYLSHHRLRPLPAPAPVPEMIPTPPPVKPDFAAIQSVVERKTAFITYLLPEIVKENQKIRQLRQQLLKIRSAQKVGQNLALDQRHLLEQLTQRYKLKKSLTDPKDQIGELMIRVDEIPVSMVLAQAAIESAWGTSRFATQANNYFGQWCFSKGCGVVPKQRTSGAIHEVRRFDNTEQALSAYFININTHYAYAEFRSLRALLRQTHRPLQGELLISGLQNYSQRGEAYVEELRNIILSNKLNQLD